MASVKEIKKRIGTVKNTAKITKTMEMVSTAKSKKALDRVIAARPYAQNVNELLKGLSGLARDTQNPYYRTAKLSNRVALFAITANRGLCGGYISNINKMTMRRIEALRAEGKEVELTIFGKKGISYFTFKKEAIHEKIVEFDDKVTSRELEPLTETYINRFLAGEIDSLEVVYTKFFSAASQQAHTEQVLPLTFDEGQTDGDESASGASGNALFEPDPLTILKTVLPMSVKNKIFQFFLEAFCAEHIYRRIAMKSASDNAGDMIKSLTRTYNRARQAKITQEIAEIVGGADAIS